MKVMNNNKKKLLRVAVQGQGPKHGFWSITQHFALEAAFPLKPNATMAQKNVGRIHFCNEQCEVNEEGKWTSR